MDIAHPTGSISELVACRLRTTLWVAHRSDSDRGGAPLKQLRDPTVGIRNLILLKTLKSFPRCSVGTILTLPCRPVPACQSDRVIRAGNVILAGTKNGQACLLAGKKDIFVYLNL